MCTVIAKHFWAVKLFFDIRSFFFERLKIELGGAERSGAQRSAAQRGSAAGRRQRSAAGRSAENDFAKSVLMSERSAAGALQLELNRSALAENTKADLLGRLSVARWR